MYLVSLILLLALVSDLLTSKIPNELFAFGFITSQIWCLYTGSVYSALEALASGMLVALILFPMFAIGSLGAGDIKIIMLLPAYTNLKNVFYIVFLSFLIAAVYGVIKLWHSKNLTKSIRHFFHYIELIKQNSEIARYEEFEIGESIILAENKIHMMVPISLSAFWILGGGHIWIA